MKQGRRFQKEQCTKTPKQEGQGMPKEQKKGLKKYVNGFSFQRPEAG